MTKPIISFMYSGTYSMCC